MGIVGLVIHWGGGWESRDFFNRERVWARESVGLGIGKAERRMLLDSETGTDTVGKLGHRRFADAAHVGRPFADALGLDDLQLGFEFLDGLHAGHALILRGDVDHDQNQRDKHFQPVFEKKITGQNVSLKNATENVLTGTLDGFVATFP